MIEGYASNCSVQVGEFIDFHLSATQEIESTLTLRRVGHHSILARITAQIWQQPFPPSEPWRGFGWVSTLRFQVPSDWSSGLFILQSEDETNILTFVVRPLMPGGTSLKLVHVPDLTTLAYCAAGGKSLYRYNSEEERANSVSLDRPGIISYPCFSLAAWLETEGIQTEWCSSIDLHADRDLLKHYDCLILVGHDEYWTKEMRDAAENFQANGGNIVALSGNTCYRQVRLESRGREMVFHQTASADSYSDTMRKAVAWADPPVNRPPQRLLGAGWTCGAHDGPLSAYTVHFPQHWVFSGTTLVQSPSAATRPFMFYESDAAEFVTEPEGYPRVTGEEGTPLSYLVLGSADLRHWVGKPGWATFGIMQRHGVVFHAGTTEWAEELPRDPDLATITRNVLERLGRRSVAEWVDIGHAPPCRALSAWRNRLLMISHDGRVLMRHPVAADVPWRPLGVSHTLTAIAASEAMWFAASAEGTLVWRNAEESDLQSWSEIDIPPPPQGIVGMTLLGGMLYASDAHGRIWRRPANVAHSLWGPLNEAAQVPGGVGGPLAAHSGHLFATSRQAGLIRSAGGFLDACEGWLATGMAEGGIGLATLDNMLYRIDDAGRLARLDLAALAARDDVARVPGHPFAGPTRDE